MITVLLIVVLLLLLWYSAIPDPLRLGIFVVVLVLLVVSLLGVSNVLHLPPYWR
jgi:hypothetical protein